MASERQEAFRKIFLAGGWAHGEGETASGAGSTINYTAKLRHSLPPLLQTFSIGNILDAPCGDFNWMQSVDIGATLYIGVDIVPEIIEDNKRKYANQMRRFVHRDIISDPLPNADLMLCRDLLRHIPLLDCKKLLKNFVDSKIEWLLITSYLVERNEDIDSIVGSRQINLQKPPFCLPQPKQRIPDWIEGFAERYVCLWPRNDVATAVSSYDL